MQSGWNVSLFHYRNHGADVGKILLGIQAPKEDGVEFEKFLKFWGISITRRRTTGAQTVLGSNSG